MSARARSLWRRLLLLALFGLLLGALRLSVYGLPDGLKSRILGAMQVPGMTTLVGSIRLGLFEGLVAADVRVHRQGDIGPPILEARELVLHFRPAAWLDGDQAFFGMRVRQGVLRIPVAGFARLPTAFEEKPMEYLALAPVDVTLSYERSGALRVSDFDGRLGGIHLTGRGLIALQRGPAPAPEAGPRMLDAAQLAKAADFLGRLQPGRRFDVDFEVYLDPADPAGAHARLAAEGEGTGFGDVFLGTWSAKAALARGEVTGSASVGESSAMGVWVESAQGRFAFSNAAVRLDGLELVLGRDRGRGRVSGCADLNLASRVCSGSVTSAIHPNVLLPALDRLRLPQAAVIRDFTFFRAPPSVRGAFEFRPGADNYFKMTGSANARDLRFRGARAISVTTDFVMDLCPTGSLVRLSPLAAARWEGSGEGTLAFDFLNGKVTFDLASTMDPEAVAFWIGPFMTRLIAPYRFNGPSHITASGVAGMWNPMLNDIQVEMDLVKPGAFAFDADRARLEFMVDGWNIDFPVLVGEIAGGTLDAFLSVWGPPDGQGRMKFAAQGELRQAEFGAVLDSLGFPNPEGYAGLLSGSGLLAGQSGTNWPGALEGEVSVIVEDGRIFRIPLFGGLTELLSSIIPGLDWIMRQTDASAAFDIGGGRARSEEIRIEGDVLSLTGSGEYAFPDDLDFDFQARFLRQHTIAGKVVSGLTWPLTKALETHLGGRLREPRWSLRHMPAIFSPDSDSPPEERDRGE